MPTPGPVDSLALVDTVLIVDDHDGYRSFLAMMLGDGDFDVVGSVDDGESAVEAVRSLHPDLVLLDVQLPGIDGFEVAEQVSHEPAPPLVVLISTRDVEDFGSRLEAAPIVGFLPKHALSVDALAELLDSHRRAS